MKVRVRMMVEKKMILHLLMSSTMDIETDLRYGTWECYLAVYGELLLCYCYDELFLV
jgi:hypothetical protein